MRIVSVTTEQGPRAAIVEGEDLFDAGQIAWQPVRGVRLGRFADFELLAPLRPRNIVCVGLNYRDHAAEAGLEVPSRPLLFAKWTSSVISPGGAIRLPSGLSEDIDYEAELGVVIGKTTRAVGVADALDSVFGYTCVNDVSARDLQRLDGQWSRSKSFDTFCPIGPAIVTADEIADPQNLRIRCLVNGEVVQDSNTSWMVFGVAELISFISQGMTLEPGDLIATGTPPGVGVARTPPVFLRPGDDVVVDIAGIGALQNPVKA